MKPALVRRNASAMAFLAIAVAVAGLCLVALASVSASPYEQLGTAAFPRAVAVLTLAFALMKAIGMVRAAAPAPASDDGDWGSRLLVGPGAMLGLAVLYLLALAQTEIDFRVVTSVFLFVATWVMAGRIGLRGLVVLALVAIAVSVGLDLLFKHFLYVDL